MRTKNKRTSLHLSNADSMMDPSRLSSVPKMMLPVYEKIVGLTDDVCDRHLNYEYRDLARAMTGALCRKRPSPVASGQPRTWACSIVYVLGRINFRRQIVFSAHDDGQPVRCIRCRPEHRPRQGARYRKDDWGPAVQSAVDAAELGREEPARMDGRGEWPASRFAKHAPGNPENCLRRRIDPLHSRGWEKPILNATGAPKRSRRRCPCCTAPKSHSKRSRRVMSDWAGQAADPATSEMPR